MNKEELNNIKEYLYKGKILYEKITKKKHKITSSTKTSTYPSTHIIKNFMEGKRLTSIIKVDDEHYQYKHGTQKPLELMSRIVKLVSNENDIILDCFAGSGSTLLGAIKNDRNYIGIEIDREYYNICCNRIKEKQGLFAGV